MADSSESTPFLASNDRADDTDALTNAEDEIPTKTLPANAHFKRPIKILIICVSIASLLGVIFLAASYIIVYVGSYQGYNYNVRFVLRELGTCLFISFISSTLMIFLQLPIVVSFITQFVFSILTLVFAGNVFERGWPGNGWYYDYRWKETASILIGIGGGFGFLVGLLYLALVLLQVIAISRAKFWKRHLMCPSYSSGQYTFQITLGFVKKRSQNIDGENGSAREESQLDGVSRQLVDV